MPLLISLDGSVKHATMFIYFSYNDYTYMNSTSGLYFGIVAESSCLIKVVWTPWNINVNVGESTGMPCLKYKHRFRNIKLNNISA